MSKPSASRGVVTRPCAGAGGDGASSAVASNMTAIRCGRGRSPFLMRGESRRDGMRGLLLERGDRKSTRLNSSHVAISYAVFCLKKKKRVKNHAVSTGLQTGRHEAL